MKLLVLGIFIILNALAFSFYWIASNNPSKPMVIAVCIIAIIVGMFFTLHDRAIEITFKGIGKIKAAAKQAVIDAEAISELKKRIENQSNTIDIVAQKATEAQESIRELETIAKFSRIVTEAQNDNRRAFNELVAWVDNKSSDLWELAANAVVRIRAEYGGPIKPGYMNVKWKEGIEPKKLSIVEIRNYYRESPSLYHADVVNCVWENEIIPKKDKMEFFVDVLREDDSLTATLYAGGFFIRLAKDPELKWNPFSTKPLLDWWEENKNKNDVRIED